MDNKLVSAKKTGAIFLTIGPVAGIIGITSPFNAAYGEAYQNAKSDNRNIYIYDIEQIQLQQQTETNNNSNFDVIVTGQQQVTPEEEEALNALTGNSNGNGEPLLNLDRNIENANSMGYVLKESEVKLDKIFI